MENEKPILTPEQIERLSEALHQVWKAVKAMTEEIAVWWQAEIVETLQKLSELAIDVDKYYRETPKRKHKTPYKRSYKTRLFDKRSRVHRCRNNC